MTASTKRQSAKKGNRAPSPRPGKNSDGVNRKPAIGGTSGAGDAGIPPQLAALAAAAGGADPSGMAPPQGAPANSIPPPPAPGGMPMGAPPGAPPNPNQPGVGGQAPAVTNPGPGMAPAMGAGFPEDMQGYPGDMQGLQQTMSQGFGPGSSAGEHDQAMTAAAKARASEHQAMTQAFEQNQQEMDILELGRLLSAIMQRRSLSEASAQQPGTMPQLGAAGR
jgi:hypothetical protein